MEAEIIKGHLFVTTEDGVREFELAEDTGVYLIQITHPKSGSVFNARMNEIEQGNKTKEKD